MHRIRFRRTCPKIQTKSHMLGLQTNRRMDFRSKWGEIKAQVDSADFLSSYKKESPKWSEEKLAFYNKSLDGKVLIPQPFGVLKNAYEPSSGFCISI